MSSHISSSYHIIMRLNLVCSMIRWLNLIGYPCNTYLHDQCIVIKFRKIIQFQLWMQWTRSNGHEVQHTAIIIHKHRVCRNGRFNIQTNIYAQKTENQVKISSEDKRNWGKFKNLETMYKSNSWT